MEWGAAVAGGLKLAAALLLAGIVYGIVRWLRRNAVWGARTEAEREDARRKAEAHEAVAESRRHPGPGAFGGRMREVDKPIGGDVAGPPGGGPPPA